MIAEKVGRWEDDVQSKQNSGNWESGIKAMEEAIKQDGIDFHVSEIYSPPRITSMARKMGLIPGMALDLSTTDPDDDKPWDFNNPAKRRKAKRLVKTRRALLLVVSPMCAAFSQLQTLNWGRMTEEQIQEVKAYGLKHLEFCMQLCKIQAKNGLYFLHEHPAGARSWQEPCVQEVMGIKGVQKVVGNMCAFGPDVVRE